MAGQRRRWVGGVCNRIAHRIQHGASRIDCMPKLLRKSTQRQKAHILRRTPAHWLPNMDMAKAPVLLQALKPAPMDIVGAALVSVRYIPALANKPMLMRQPILLPDTERHIKPKPAHCLLSMDTATVQLHLKRNTIRRRTDTAAHSVK